MKKIAILLMFLPLASFGADRWKITFVTGTAQVKPLKESSWTTCKSGDILNENSVIRTGHQSSVVLEQNNRRLVIDADSVFSLKSLTKTVNKRAQISITSTNRILKKITNKTGTYRSEISGVRGKKIPDGPGDKPAWSDDLSEEDTESDKGELAEAGRCFRKGDYECVHSALDKKLSAFRGEDKDRASFLFGSACFHMALYDKSLDYLETASMSKTLEADLRRSAMLKHALAVMFLGNPEKAAKELKALDRKYPDTEQHKKALFVLGNINYMLGRDSRALYWYKKFLNTYPDDELSVDVRKLRATLK